MKNIDATPKQIEEAREWVADSFEDGEDRDWTDDEIVCGVNRAFVGGWAAFAATVED